MGDHLGIENRASGSGGGGPVPAASLTGIVAQANGGTGTDTSALANGVLVKSAGNVTTSIAPTMSGANLSSGTVPPSSILGSTSGRVLVDTGTTGAFTDTPVGLTLSGASNTFTNIPAATALSGAVPASNGGTGKATWTANAIPVATGVTTIGEIAPGTAGKVLTSNGAGSPPSMQAPVTSNTASASAGASYTLTTNAYEAVTGLSVSLAAGTWLVMAEVRSSVQWTSAGVGLISLKLRNNTAAADIADSERLGAIAPTIGTAYSATTSITAVVTLASTSTLQVYAVSPAGPTYTTRDIYSDSDGRSRLVAVRIA